MESSARLKLWRPQGLSRVTSLNRISSIAISNRGSPWSAARALAASADANDLRHAGGFKYFLNVERDQEFVVQHEAAFAGKY